MYCDEFMKRWYDAHDGCGEDLPLDARAHLSACPTCQTEIQAVDDLERAMRRSLSRQALLARPRPAAVAAAVSAAIAASSMQTYPPAPLPEREGGDQPSSPHRREVGGEVLAGDKLPSPPRRGVGGEVPGRRPARKRGQLYFLPPAAEGAARWAVAAVLIVALSVLGRGQPAGALPAYADATATAAAMLPSVTPSATFTAYVGTPAVVSFVRATSTPAPP